MFVQVIQGKVADPSAMRAAGDRWLEQLAPGATGWLGTTSGVTEDGRFILLARFTSEDAAMRNSDRPEQGEWWTETSKLFDGDAEFKNSVAVDEDMVGDPGTAGFVQVVLGKVSDVDRARELMRQDPQAWSQLRPDLLGTLTVVHDNGELTTAAYFTSEEEARAGESREVPADMREEMAQIDALTVGQPEYLDLKEPWLHAPKG
jgi:hypothetical protein